MEGETQSFIRGEDKYKTHARTHSGA